MDDKDKFYIASCSFGKDSIATILLALEHNEPLDRAVYCGVMFDNSRNISAEIPEHSKWIHSIAIPRLQALGVKVDALKTSNDMVSIFNRQIKKSTRQDRIGKIYGFPIGGMCYMNNLCKVKTIKDYLRDYKGFDIIQYIGIASDEHKRLKRLEGTNKVSLLNKYGYTEEMAMDLCKKNDLVSPLYETSFRGGCFFCPNAKIQEYIMLRRHHPELWNELKNLDSSGNRATNNFKWGKTLTQVEKIMDIIEKQQSLF